MNKSSIRLSWLALCLCATLTAFANDAKNWSGFRGNGDSQTTAKKLPLEWSDTKNKAWDIKLPGYGQSSPVIWRNRVFITAIDGPNKEQAYVLCYDLKSGRELWRKTVATSEKVKVGDRVSQAAPTPVIDDKRIYVFFETGNLYAFDHHGKPQWERQIIKEYGAVKGPHGLGSLFQCGDARDELRSSCFFVCVERVRHQLFQCDITQRSFVCGD